jgi:hypothetical protein
LDVDAPKNLRKYLMWAQYHGDKGGCLLWMWVWQASSKEYNTQQNIPKVTQPCSSNPKVKVCGLATILFYIWLTYVLRLVCSKRMYVIWILKLYVSYVRMSPCSVHIILKKILSTKGHCSIKSLQEIRLRHSLQCKNNVVVFKESSSSSQSGFKHSNSPSSLEFDVDNECEAS